MSYRVYKLKDIIYVIIPHFELYHLQSSKYVYYYLWQKSAHLMAYGLHVTDTLEERLEESIVRISVKIKNRL